MRSWINKIILENSKLIKSDFWEVGLAKKKKKSGLDKLISWLQLTTI